MSARDYEDVLEQLAASGVVSRALREQLRGLGGFRNLLVHDYLRLDRRRLEERLAAAPLDLGAFAAAVAEWLPRAAG